MSSRHPSGALHRLSQTALAIAAVVFVWASITAIRTTPTVSVSESAASGDSSRRSEVATLSSAGDDAIERAVAHDMFSTTRTAPARRYSRALSEAEDSPYADDEVTEPAESPLLPTVHGTAVSATGDGFAMCAMPGAPPTVVRVGDAVGEYTVVRIERERVTFRDPSGHRHIIAANASSAGEDR